MFQYLIYCYQTQAYCHLAIWPLISNFIDWIICWFSLIHREGVWRPQSVRIRTPLFFVHRLSIFLFWCGRHNNWGSWSYTWDSCFLLPFLWTRLNIFHDLTTYLFWHSDSFWLPVVMGDTGIALFTQSTITYSVQCTELSSSARIDIQSHFRSQGVEGASRLL